MNKNFYELNSMISTLNSVRKENEYSEYMRYPKLIKAKEDFFEYFTDFALSTNEYGWHVVIKFPMINGNSEYSSFHMKFTPFERNDDLLLIGYWDNEGDKCNVFYSFNPKLRNDFKVSNGIVVPVFDFVLLQVLDKQKDIKEMFINQLNEDLNRRINFDSHLNDLYKMYYR